MGCLKKGRFLIGLMLGTFLVLSSSVALAQRPLDLNPNSFNNQFNGQDDNQTMPNYGNPAGVQDNNEQQVADTTKKPPKIRKPLESYFFNDTVRKRQSFVWNINLDNNDVNMVQIDTAITGFQNDYPYIQDGIGSIYLGNLGAASTPLNYFERPDYINFSFAEAFNTYLMTPQRARFFNVKKPFTHLSYYFAGQTKRMEENLHLAHAQNISPSTGFNIEYKSMGTRGIYTNQKSRDKNLSVGFSHTGKKYTVHAGYIYNSITLKENGGIKRDGDITDTVFEMPELIEVNLNNARNVLKNNTFYLIQSYGIPLRKLTDDDFSIADRSSIFFGHSIEYSRFFKKYTDEKSGAGDYYKDWFINSTASNDSIFESKLSNRLFVQIQPWDRNGVIGVINGGIGSDIHHYYNFNLNDYISKQGGVNRNSIFVYGSVLGNISKYFGWNANIEYHPLGYRSQDMTLGGGLTLSAYIKNSPITLKGNIVHQRRTPGYWTEQYFSNHFVWNNSFNKENETRLSLTLNIPAISMELGAWQSINENKVYFDAAMKPAQESGSVSVTGLYARKDFRLGGLHLNHRALLQFSTKQEVIPVPLASVYLSYFYEFSLVKEVLRLQIGIDGRYNTEYYAFGYNPATAQFYNQREKKLGGYPYMDFFVAAKWKRMRILAKLQHANEDLFGDRNYFSVLHYPLNQRVFKLGFSWTFYD